MRKFAPVFAFLTTAAWLVPNHYPPWLAAWNEGLAISGLLMLVFSVAVGTSGGARVSWHLLLVAVVSAAVVLAQLATGKLLFAGDAVMVILYIGLWFVAVLAGSMLGAPSAHSDAPSALEALMLAWCLVALLSVGIALVQWTGAVSLGIYAADLPPGTRPFANVAQPNHFSTLSFLGLCGLLWLYQSRKVNGAAFLLGAGFLLLGMIMSQSRTGWLQLGLLLVGGMIVRDCAQLRITRAKLLALGAFFAGGVMLWPKVNDLLLLSAGRSLGDQMQAGVRLPYWRSMLDAIGREPLFGYGWQQVGAAQQRVALDHPAVGTLFDNSHNFVLDILLWNGLPIGLMILAILGLWFITSIHACRNPKVVWLLAAVAGVLTHAMLEYPLAYAYFLIPTGIAMGAIESLSPAGWKAIRLPRSAVLVSTLLLSALFLTIATEYLKTEERFRILRFELARIGQPPTEIPLARTRLLTQLDSFLEYYGMEAKPGMAPEQLEKMRRVSERYGFSTIILRYALAAGLNGQPEVARETLARICRIHQARRCDEARESWVALQAKYPQLSDVMMPERQVSMVP